jgi:hypothetical protein
MQNDITNALFNYDREIADADPIGERLAGNQKRESMIYEILKIVDTFAEHAHGIAAKTSHSFDKNSRDLYLPDQVKSTAAFNHFKTSDFTN